MTLITTPIRSKQSLHVASNPQIQCPGDGMWIDHAIHQGRIDAGYPACTTCQHRLNRVESQRSMTIKNVNGGIRGLANGAITTSLMTRYGRAISVMTAHQLFHTQKALPPEHRRVMIGYDWRAATPAMAISLLGGLQDFGTSVVMIGNCDRSVLRYSLIQSGCFWGLWVTGEGMGPGDAGFDILTSNGESLPPADWKQLEMLSQFSTLSRPERRSVPPQQANCLSQLHQSRLRLFHALRPLKLVVQSHSPHAESALKKLATELNLEIQWLQPYASSEAMPQAIRSQRRDLGIVIDEAGERLRCFNEAGQAVSIQAVLRGITRMLMSRFGEQSPVVVGRMVDEPFQCLQVASEAELVARLKQGKSRLGLDQQDRLWFSHQDQAECDAMKTLAYLIQTLSQSSLPASYVLDETEAKRVGHVA